MSSPLFRTLQIGSLRYWGSDVEIINSQILENLDIDLADDDLSINYDENNIVLILQKSDFSLEFDDTKEIELQSFEVKIDKDC